MIARIFYILEIQFYIGSLIYGHHAIVCVILLAAAVT
jgi:hypothetical protein